MYLHIGEDILVKTKDIIAILDKQLLNHSPLMDEFFKKAGTLEKMTIKSPIKSIIVTKDQLYYSPLSSSTLMKRSTQHPFEESATVNR
ncbi:extracellular matrix regulator RemB [Peribacillus alkalitolerans]|uniref:extracellular matrix regulator RemB n=1 Tax=Peribacillus alkalitolerans TaxID=1550385 RepID=UPI0013D77B71|nr:extracellular matrix/biofilm biosynthesis regulator RemA family protein [Peribacillus alkalitolerans]